MPPRGPVREPTDIEPNPQEIIPRTDCLCKMKPWINLDGMSARTQPRYRSRVMVTGYTNDYVGYIPARDRYDFEKLNALSYPAYFTPWICGDFRYREDVGDVLVHEMVRLGQEIAGRTP